MRVDQSAVRGQTKIETASWNPHRNYHEVATASGCQVIAWDTRSGDQSWTLHSNNNNNAIRPVFTKKITLIIFIIFFYQITEQPGHLICHCFNYHHVQGANDLLTVIFLVTGFVKEH